MSEPTQEQVEALAKLLRSFPAIEHQTFEQYDQWRARRIFAAGYLPPEQVGHPRVQGLCPRCDGATLFLGAGGYVTCSSVECSNPVSASQLLGVQFGERNQGDS